MNPSSHSYTSFKGNKLLAKALLGSASWLMMSFPALAVTCNILGGNAVINAPCTDAFVGGDPFGAYNPAIYNNGSLTNNSDLSQTAGNPAFYALFKGNGFNNYTLYNNGTITATSNIAVEAGTAGGNTGTFNINNMGTISGRDNINPTISIGLNVFSSYITNAKGAVIENTAAAGGQPAMLLRGTVVTFTNSGIIRANNLTGDGIQLDGGGKITSFTNTGLISSSGSFGILINGAGSEIKELNNLQGINGSGGQVLTYRGKLPTNYNVIIDGQQYGQLSVDTPTGTTTYGVSSLTDTRKLQQGKVYSSVLSGVPTANLNNTTGKVGDRGTFTLRENGANTWDMTIDGLWTPVIGYMNPNVANTYTAVSANRDAVSGALHQRYAVLNAVMEYDCSRFDKYGVCLSFQARATGYGDQTTGAGVFNIAKRVTENIRAGVFLDYQAAQATPFATNGYNGGIQWGYNNPTFGGYVGWSDKADGTGIQARVSGGYNPGKITVNRAMLDYAEPGSGTAGLNAYYAYGVAGYGVSVGNGVIVTPYGGLRYTDVTRNAYTENFVPGWVLFPLAYNAYYEQLITGLTGAKAQAMLTDKFGVNVALGGEFDFNRNANGYGGYSYAPGMEAWGVNHGGSWNGVRPAGIIGAFYDVNKNDRLMLNAYVGEQAWSSRTYTNLLAGYQVAF